MLAGLGLVRAALGPDGVRRVFRLVLTDNGPEFADEDGIAALFGELPGETRLFYCGPAAPTRRAAARRTTSRSGSCCPRAGASPSTASPAPTRRS